jgi:hypothetical protein
MFARALNYKMWGHSTTYLPLFISLMISTVLLSLAGLNALSVAAEHIQSSNPAMFTSFST